MTIGITGTDGAGKGVAVDYLLKHKGFTHYHGRALFIQEIERRGLENSRISTRLVANEIRKKYGNDAIVKLFLEQAKEKGDTKIVIDSIRATAEAGTLKKNGGVLLSIDADQRLRYERIVARGSGTDNVSFEEFVEQEELEMDDPDPHGMQKRAVIEMADYTIMNDGALEELHAKIDDILQKIEKKA